jgi:hypothetical protein
MNWPSLALRAVVGNVGSMGATIPSIPTGRAFLVEWLLSFAVWRAHLLYWLAPIIATIVAARTYDLLRPMQPPTIAAQQAMVGVEGPVAPEGG